ncbi:MAG: hypothetical protein ABI035_06990 [Gemmatimonadaceae bacterium]
MNIVAFLDHLANARSDAAFVRTAAGLASLQVYDSVRTHGFDPFVHEEILTRVAADIASITVESSVRVALDSVAQALPFWDAEGTIRIGHRAVFTALLNYGQALGDEGEWALAENVYAGVGMDAELDGETWLAAEARLLMGRASRMCADWQTSQVAYRRAYELGTDAGDIAIALRAQIGEANNLWMRGDFPAAKRLLARTAHRARQSCPNIVPRVTLAIAGLANAAGEYERAIGLTFDLLQTVAREDEVRYQALVDLAAYLVDYGLPSVAAEALRVVEGTAPEPRVRRHAQLNRFFLAARHDTELQFTASRVALAEQILSPRQQTQFALFAAQGYRRFDRLDSAFASAADAIALAKQYEFFQLMFEAETELHTVEAAKTADVIPVILVAVPPTRERIGKTLYRSTTGARPSPRMRRVAESLEDMVRQLATVDGA